MDDMHPDEQIMNALAEGNLILFSQLLDAHADLMRYEDGRNRWLTDAAQMGKLNIVKYLVDMGADVNEQSYDEPSRPEGALDAAVRHNHVPVVQWLLEHGAKVNFTIDGHTRCMALTAASRKGYLEVVKLLLQYHAEMNCAWAQKTPLDHALENNKTEVAEYLRSLGGKTAAELSEQD